MRLQIIDQSLLVAVEAGLIDLVVELFFRLLADRRVGRHLAVFGSIGSLLVVGLFHKEVYLMIVGIKTCAVYIVAGLVGIPHAHGFAAHKRNVIEAGIFHVAAQQSGLHQRAQTDLIHLDFKLKLAILAGESQLLLSDSVHHYTVAEVDEVEFHLQGLAVLGGPAAYSRYCEHRAQQGSLHMLHFSCSSIVIHHIRLKNSLFLCYITILLSLSVSP